MNQLADVWEEGSGTSMLGAQYGPTAKRLEEFLPVFAKSQQTQPITTKDVSDTNLIPDAMRAYWYRLSKSRLPKRAFNELLMAASSNDRVLNGPLKPLSSESLRGFLKLWEAVRHNSAEPVLSISPAGEVIAEWFSDPDNCLVLMFNRNGNLFYSLMDRGQPCEGITNCENPENLAAMFLVRNPNPFGWSDADEG